MTSTKQLIRMKEELDEEKEHKIRLEGRLAEIGQTIKKKFGCRTPKEARKLLAEKKSLLQDKKDELGTIVEEIEDEI